MNVLKPTIHLNGTSRAQLHTDYRNAAATLRRALNDLAATAPHGRDYYVQSGNAIATAIEQHVSRVQRVESVMKELEEIAVHLMDDRR